MDLLEFQGKQLLQEAGVPTLRFDVARSAAEARSLAERLGRPTVVKAQVQSGKRGKAGAIRFAADPGEAADAAEELLGSTIGGLPVASVLVEERADIAQELYAAVLNDAASKGPLVLFSVAGGMDIEEIHEASPDSVLRLAIDIRVGLEAARAEAWLADSGLAAELRPAVAEAFALMYRAYRAADASLLEVNPLVVTSSGAVVAVDCKASLDPSGLRRHPDLAERFSADLPAAGTALEQRAREQGLLFVELDGDVGVLANGAGLTMTTLDVVNHYGGRPANFLEIGGDAYTKAVPALELVLGNPRVRSLLVNFCGAFARTDVMAEGVVSALEQLQPKVPVSFSIHGTGEAEAIRLVRERLGVECHDLMDDAVREAVANARAGLQEVN